jgi:hypothetical protein
MKFSRRNGGFSANYKSVASQRNPYGSYSRRVVSVQKIATNLQKEFDSRSWHSYPEDRYRTFSVLYLRPVATRLVGACFQYDRVARRVLLLLLIQAGLSNDRAEGYRQL